MILTLSSFQKRVATSDAALKHLYVELHERATNTKSVFISLSSMEQLDMRLTHIANSDPHWQLPLHGVPFTVKDNIDVLPHPTTAGCPPFTYQPKQTAYVVQRLENAGGVMLGKTNMDQFACGLTGMRSPYGSPKNVHNANYIPGGSSSGSAVSVAMGLCVFSLGTDTAGSGRVPAAMNNIVGLKPTKGILSTSGVVAACASLDCVSIFACTVIDAAVVLHHATSYDEMNAYSRVVPSGRQMKLVSEMCFEMNDKQMSFGVPQSEWLNFHGDLVAEKSFNASVKALEGKMHMKRVDIEFYPFQKVADLLYESALVSERFGGSNGIGEFIQKHYKMNKSGFDSSVFSIMMNSGKGHKGHEVFIAQEKVAKLVKIAQRDTWSRVKVIVVPSVPCGMSITSIEKDAIGLNKILGKYTNFVNLMDLCAIAVPSVKVEDENNVPRGITFVGQAFEEMFLVEVAHLFETCV